jgi:hypothetical protein
MRSRTRDDLEDAVLGNLAVHDVDAGTASQIRTLAHLILAERRERAARQSGIERAYARFLEPALASVVVISYLAWAVNRALLFHRILQ